MLREHLFGAPAWGAGSAVMLALALLTSGVHAGPAAGGLGNYSRWVFDHRTGTWGATDAHTDLAPAVRYGYEPVTALCCAGQNVVYAAHRWKGGGLNEPITGSGVFHFDGMEWRAGTRFLGPYAPVIGSLLCDAHKQLWACHSGGVSVRRDGCWAQLCGLFRRRGSMGAVSLYPVPESRDLGRVHSVVQDRRGLLYASTDTVGIRVLDPGPLGAGRASEASLKPVLQGERPLVRLAQRDGRLYGVTPDGSLFEGPEGLAAMELVCGGPAGLEVVAVSALCVAPGPQIWMACVTPQGSPVCRLEAGKWSVHQPLTDMVGGRIVRDIVVGPGAGSLWFAVTGLGVLRAAGQDRTWHPVTEVLPHLEGAPNLQRHPENVPVMLVQSANQPEQVRESLRAGLAEGTTNVPVGCIAFDQAGALWVGGNNTIVRVPRP